MKGQTITLMEGQTITLRSLKDSLGPNDDLRLDAYCYPSGEIGFGKISPGGIVVFAKQGKTWASLDHVEATASYKGPDYYVVPGMEHASTPQEGVDALMRWVRSSASFWRENGLIVIDPPIVDYGELQDFLAFVADEQAGVKNLKRPAIRKYDAECSDILNCLLSELADAETAHPVWTKDAIHAAAVLAEESGELVQTAIDFHNAPLWRTEALRERIREEAIQTGAMAIRVLKYLQGYEPKGCRE